MVKNGRHLWAVHPHVDNNLTLGERAADRLKATFGSWTFLFVLNGFIAAWAILNVVGVFHFDLYPFIALNLVLSWLASQQGGALQIAANRGDKKAAELALATHQNGQQILTLNQQQMTILDQQNAVMQQQGTLLAKTAELHDRLDAMTQKLDTVATGQSEVKSYIQRGGFGVPPAPKDGER